MRLCRECGKPVEAHAQFCPWCFAFPGTAEAEQPVPAAVAAVPAVVPAAPAPAPVVEREVSSPPPPPPNPFAAARPPSPPPVERSAPAVVFSSGPVGTSVWPRVAMAAGALAIVVALVVGVLAFRDGDDDAAGERLAASRAPSGTPQEIVDRVMLRAEDLGAGWSASTAPAAPTAPDRGALAACLGVPLATPVAETARGFENGDLLSIGGGASVWADATQARAQADTAAHPRLEECSEAQAGGVIDVAVERSSVPGRPGAVHVRTRIPVEDFEMVIETVTVAQGRITVSVFGVWDRPIPEELLAQAVDAMLARV